MEEGDWRFLKNMGITTLATIAAGAGATELSDLLADSSLLNSMASTGVQIALTPFIYFYLEVRGNREKYCDNKKLKWRTLVTEGIKLGIAILPAGAVYYSARPIVMYAFQEPSSLDPFLSFFPKEGFSPWMSSLFADGVCCAMYLPSSTILARYAGVTRSSPNPKDCGLGA